MHRSPLAWLRLLLAAVLGAFLLGGPLHAAETAAPRSPAWAQAVDPSINLYRMSPTLYRSALPNAQSVALLQRLQVKTVVSFIKDDDRAWLGQAPVQWSACRPTPTGSTTPRCSASSASCRPPSAKARY